MNASWSRTTVTNMQHAEILRDHMSVTAIVDTVDPESNAEVSFSVLHTKRISISIYI